MQRSKAWRGRSVRTAEAAQVSQGWLDSRLNIAKENMNKTNLIRPVQLPLSITKSGSGVFRADLWSGKPYTHHTNHTYSWGTYLEKFTCMSWKPSDCVLIWLKWICLSAAVLDPGRLKRPLLRPGSSDPRPVETVGCQSYPRQVRNSIQSKNTAGTSGDWWRHAG